MHAWYVLNVHTCMAHMHHIQQLKGVHTTHADPQGITCSAECAYRGRRALWLHTDHDGSWCRGDRMHCMFSVSVWWVGPSHMGDLVMGMDPTVPPLGIHSSKLW